MRSKLFISGDKTSQFAQAINSAADVVCIDLEDTVAPSRKDSARLAVAELLAGLAPDALQRTMVRINGLASGHMDADLCAIVGSHISVINYPKPESGHEVKLVCQALSEIEAAAGLENGSVKLMVNIESPAGLRQVHDIAKASPRVRALQIGFADLLEPYLIDRKDTATLHQIRLAVRLGAAEAGVAAYDAVFTDPSDMEGFQQEVESARRLGFSGKSCLNLEQVEAVNAAFTPSEQELRQAQRIIEAADQEFGGGNGLFELDGRFYDEPFVMRARSIVVRASMLRK